MARPLVKAILAAPAGFYANVHTAEFPAGAIRGQLTGTSSADFGTVYSFNLNGSTEPNATGTAVLRILKDTSTVCYRLHAANVTLPTVAAHIHKGAAGVNGPVVVPFTAPGATGDSSGCQTSTPAIVDDILANPTGLLRQRAHQGAPRRARSARSFPELRSTNRGGVRAPPRPRVRYGAAAAAASGAPPFP